jgi:hypothetical protein
MRAATFRIGAESGNSIGGLSCEQIAPKAPELVTVIVAEMAASNRRRSRHVGREKEQPEAMTCTP